MLWVDTNVVCNYLVCFNEDLHRRALKIFTNGEKYYVSDIVIFETVYVFEVKCKLERISITKALTNFLLQPFIQTEEVTGLLSALFLWSEDQFMNVDFSDCLLLERAQLNKADSIVSFDKHFDLLPFPNIKPD